MDDIRKAQNFISALFTDEGVTVVFHLIPKNKANELHMMVSFMDNKSLMGYTTYYKPGCMKEFLEHIIEIKNLFEDNTALVNIPTSAKAALEYIK